MLPVSVAVITQFFIVGIKVNNQQPSGLIRLACYGPIGFLGEMFDYLFPANPHARPRQLPMCSKQYGPTKNFEAL